MSYVLTREQAEADLVDRWRAWTSARANACNALGDAAEKNARDALLQAASLLAWHIVGCPGGPDVDRIKDQTVKKRTTPSEEVQANQRL